MSRPGDFSAVSDRSTLFVRLTVVGCLSLASAALAQAPDAGELPPPPLGSVIVSIEETFLPGSSPHSPSTFGNRWNDPANVRQTSSLGGPSGLLHLQSADLGRPGLLRFSVGGEHFNLAGFPRKGDLATRTAATFAASLVALNFLELSLFYHDAAHTNSAASPRLIQTQGDVGLCARVSSTWASGLFAGVGLEVQALSGPVNQEVREYAFGVAPTAFVTYELRPPIRVHFNLGMNFDDSQRLARGNVLGSAERFALRINPYPRLGSGLGVEASLPFVTLFSEYNISIPIGVPGGTLETLDARLVPISSALSHRAAVGIKITAFENLTLMAAAEFGLFRLATTELPPNPPFNLFLSASYAVDPWHRYGTQLVERNTKTDILTPAPTVPPPTTGDIEGIVVDVVTRLPIPGAIIETRPGTPPVATAARTGSFLTQALAPGMVTLRVRKEGYLEAAKPFMVEVGKRMNAQVELQPLPPKARLLVRVLSNKKPIQAEVRLTGATPQTVSVAKGSTGPTPLMVDAGLQVLDVTSPGYLAQTRQVQVQANSEMPVVFELLPEPKKTLVIVRNDRIEILQPVHFALAKADILADSFPLLNQVVDAIVRHDIKKIRIEGHTDDRGGIDYNQRLSDARAKSVAAYLTRAGIDPARLEAVGFGLSRPIASNLTTAGREQNRRVEFKIVADPPAGEK